MTDPKDTLAQPHWDRVQQLFEKALTLKPDQLNAFLLRECAKNPELIAEVESLVEHAQGAETQLGDMVSQATGRAPLHNHDPLLGKTLGSYQLIREIGHGGMGVIYLAQRADDEYNQQVAIKVIRSGLSGKEAQQRFLMERQILANLDHPNIAKLLDGGTTDDGAPYLVIEYIEGLPIDEYCDQNRLDIRQRLDLFRKVCEAVEYAHRRLVIHRDLKPSNILVTESGEPKLLDFNIAKLLDDEKTLHTLLVTRASTGPMTPEYASPEQILGEAVTTVTDVYSLGVLLYQLLTGRYPFSTKGNQPWELEKAICESDPIRPSQSLSRITASPIEKRPNTVESNIVERIGRYRNIHPNRLGKLLSGDLDNIVLKALSKTIDRRYGSVRMLSDDIERFLKGLPILARPDGRWYRLRKFIARNPWGVSASAIMVLMMVLFAVSTFMQTSRIERERDVAQEQRELAVAEAGKAKAMSYYLYKLFLSVQPKGELGPTASVMEMLDYSVKQLENEDNLLRDQPEVDARIRLMMGQLFAELGQNEKALPLVENGLRKAKEVLDEDDYFISAAQHILARLHQEMGHFKQAEKLYLTTLEQMRKSWGNDDFETIKLVKNIGGFYWRLGKYELSESYMKEAYVQLVKINGEDDQETLGAFYNLTLLYCDRNSGKECLEKSEFISKKFEDLYGADNSRSMIAKGGLAEEYIYWNRLDEAEVMFRDLSKGYIDQFGTTNEFSLETNAKLAKILLEKGRYDEAGKLLLHNLDTREQMLGKHHPSTQESINDLAWYLYLNGDKETALERLDSSLAYNRKQDRVSLPVHTKLLSTLAKIYLREGQLNKAEPIFREVLDTYLTRHGKYHHNTLRTRYHLANLMIYGNRFEESEQMLNENIPDSVSISKNSHPLVIKSKLLMAEIDLNHEKLAQAQKSLDQIRNAITPGTVLETEYNQLKDRLQQQQHLDPGN